MMNYLEEDSINLDDENLETIELELKEKINLTFEKFESIFIKLNYSSASDSQFLVNNLRCFNLQDVLILIKGSNKIAENLSLFNKLKEDNSGKHKLYLILKLVLLLNLDVCFQFYGLDAV